MPNGLRGRLRMAIAGTLLASAAIVMYGARPTRASRQATATAVELTAPPALSDLRYAIEDLVAVALPNGQAVRGRVWGTTDRLSIHATMGRAAAHVEGSADSLPYLADQLVAELLAIQAARDSDELAAFHGTSRQALRAYLAGRDAYRRGRFGVRSDATTHFERALFLDSTFALAGLRLAEIAVRFGMHERDERWKLDAIWRQRHRLGPADRALLEAYLGPRYPRPATLAELIAAAERATVLAPHRQEAWHIAGGSFFRFGPRIGYPNWQEHATTALQRAVELDSSDVLPIQNLVLLSALARDQPSVKKYEELHRARNAAGGQQAEFVHWVAAVATGDEARLAALRIRIPEMTSGSLQSIIDWSQFLTRGLDDADRAARALEQTAVGAGRRRTVIVRVVPYLLNRGRPHAAERLLSTAERGFGQAIDVGVLEFRVYAALYWDGDSTAAAAAAQSLAAYLGGAPLPLGYIRDRSTAACALAHWRITAGNLAGAEAALSVRDSSIVESLPICRAAAEARIAAARRGSRSPAAATALMRLDALLSAGSDVQQFVPTVAAVIASRLYEACGNLEHALDLAQRRTYWWTWLVSTPLRDQGRLAVMLSDTATAIHAYRHFLVLRSDAEPELLPETQRVRALVRALELRASADPKVERTNGSRATRD